ncbi:hypothetical protein [Streptomyces sp. AP-93]|uniref:hypothetical protein n=1 Tax=Streptomyces sp. AP-93 TaxID=2929048 RepID=UPI001FAFAEF5|nr:hypothetical protein [Streptomyces sp. AP-93]MCJ0869678.1 hypothetical protein [Streptomyces sp. AP-93]
MGLAGVEDSRLVPAVERDGVRGGGRGFVPAEGGEGRRPGAEDAESARAEQDPPAQRPAASRTRVSVSTVDHRIDDTDPQLVQLGDVASALGVLGDDQARSGGALEGGSVLGNGQQDLGLRTPW